MRHVQILRWEKKQLRNNQLAAKSKGCLHAMVKPQWRGTRLDPQAVAMDEPPPVREAAVNATIFLWLVAAGPGPECQGARNQGPTGLSGREDFVGSCLFIDDVPAVGSAATAPWGRTGWLRGLSWARALGDVNNILDPAVWAVSEKSSRAWSWLRAPSKTRGKFVATKMAKESSDAAPRSRGWSASAANLLQTQALLYWVSKGCRDVHGQPDRNWLTVLLIRYKMAAGLILSIKQMFLLGKNLRESSC